MYFDGYVLFVSSLGRVDVCVSPAIVSFNIFSDQKVVIEPKMGW